MVLYYHNRHHRDVDTIVTMVRNDVWLAKVRKLASAIDSKCVECKVKRKKLSGQVMGDLPTLRTDMLPPFVVTGMDLLRPQEVRDEVVKRGPKCTKKVWIVIFTCLSTIAVQLDIATDYSHESILH